MTRTFRQIIDTRIVKVYDVSSDTELDSVLLNYKPDAITVELSTGIQISLYRHIDESEIFIGYYDGNEYTCKI